MVVRRVDSVSQLLRKLAERSQAENASDAALLARFLGHRDEAAFVTLLHRHGPLVLGVCRRVLGNSADAEDAFQATFVVLLRNACSIAKQDSISSWLHGVARRVAVRAKIASDRRRVREQQQTLPLAPDALQAVVWQDLRSLLDEEVGRLPDVCRLAFVLCYLQGKTNAEAARVLGCPTGTIQSRLARAREILRGRLSRRGLTLSSGMVTTMLAQPATAASVPAELTAVTLEAAKVLTAHNAAAAGVLSAQAAALVEGMVTSMMLTKLATAAAFLLTATLTVGVAALAFPRQAASQGPIAVAQPEPPPSEPAQLANSPLEDPRVVEAIKAAGGKVNFWGERRSRWVQVEFLDGNGNDESLRLLQGLQHLESLTLSGEPFTDAGLVHVKDITTIRRLGLTLCRLTDAGLAHLNGWTHLEGIWFNALPITGEGLEHLKGVPLKALHILGDDAGRGQTFNDAGMAQLPRFPRLETLHLNCPAITDAGLQHLTKLPRLRNLSLASDAITDNGLVHLRALAQGKLEDLQISSAAVTDAGLEHLKDLIHLKHLVLGQARVTGDGLLHLERLSQLTGLGLSDTAITDAGLAHLRPWARTLDNLDLDQTGITDAGLAHLQGFGKLRSLSLAGTKVTDAGLVRLRALTTLERLNLKDTAVTTAGIAELQKVLPEVQIEP